MKNEQTKVIPIEQIVKTLKAARKVSVGPDHHASFKYRVIPLVAGQRNLEVKINAMYVALACDRKAVKYAFKCNVDTAKKYRLRYVSVVSGDDHSSIWVDNTDAARAVTLYLVESDTDIFGEVFPRVVADEPIPFQYIQTYPVSGTEGAPAAIGFPDYVFRCYELSCPLPDPNRQTSPLLNFDPVYVVSYGGSGIGRQIMPGGCIWCDHTSPRVLGFWSPGGDQLVTLRGLYGLLDPHVDDSSHTTPPSFEAPT